LGKSYHVSQTLTSKEKTLLLNDAVYYELLFTFGVSTTDHADYCAWEHLNFSRMGHARALLYFFESPLGAKKWPDDLVSEDFGFPSAAVPIHKDERERLNKDLFHLSSRRLRHTRASKPWTNAILQHIHDRAVAFIDFLLSPAPARDFEVAHPAWEGLSSALKSGREIQISRHFSRDGQDSGWILQIGRVLASGKTELSVVHAT
jgi:hypothetical protein